MNKRPVTSQRLLAAEGLCAIWVLALLSLGAVFYPLEPVLSPDASGQTARAPWLFLGLQELLKFLPPKLAGLVMPLASMALMAALPWLAAPKNGPGLPAWGKPASVWEYAAWALMAAWAGITLLGALA